MNYTVKKGDSLYSIAKSFDTTVSEIMSFNNLSSTVLSIGQVLKIPTMETGQNYGVYLVQKGEYFVFNCQSIWYYRIRTQGFESFNE